MILRPATAADAETLTALAFQAKAHWGYDAAFMEACRDELSYTAEQVAAGGFQVAEADGRIQGFYALTKCSPDTLELDALFVDPPAIGRGIGRALFQHALAAAAGTGHIRRMIIQADPNAAAFYDAAGAERIGERPSDSISGRNLPLYEILIGPGAGTATPS